MPKLAAISMTSTSAKEVNVATAVRMIREAATCGADWIQLPEMFAFHGPYDRIHAMAEADGGPICRLLSGLAQELKVIIMAGSMGERTEGETKVFNTAFVFGRQGENLAKYRKTHLFRLDDKAGGAVYDETQGYLAGDRPVSFEADGWRFGLSICYDLRFPRYYDLLEKSGAPDVILAPSAFTKGTGIHHWELLLRARAVERQAFVFAANQVGQHSPGKESFGHAMIVDPWGKVLASTGAEPGIAYATIERSTLDEARGKLPALKNRRPELYGR